MAGTGFGGTLELSIKPDSPVDPDSQLALVVPARPLWVAGGDEDVSAVLEDPDSPPGWSHEARKHRAAQYVRMSTEYQQYSTANQMATIAEYAARYGLEIVRTYADDGKSGLSAKWRRGLRLLLADVIAGTADFGTVLVYDVTRWGRFQDSDESAYYEFVCRKEGVHVEYCAEPFRNDLSASSSLLKNIKRMMAGEFSRELSVKVYAGKCRAARRGVSVGARALYGMRRMLVDSTGKRRGVLNMGEAKFSQTDRIILVPGPPNERRVVRWIFAQVASHGKCPAEITRELNRRGEKRPGGGPWLQQAVGYMLGNEKYAGTMVYNRRSAKLRGPSVPNPPEQWIRVEGAFEPLIKPEVFRRVQAVLRRNPPYMSEQTAIILLRALFDREGRLTTKLIEAEPGMPGPDWYRDHFGGLCRAYAKVGYAPRRDYQFLEGRVGRTRLVADFRARVVEALQRAGVPARRECAAVYALESGLRVGIVGARFLPWKGLARWKAQMHIRPSPDWLLAARINATETEVMDQSLIRGGQHGVWLNSTRHWGGREERRFADLDQAIDVLAKLDRDSRAAAKQDVGATGSQHP